MELDELCESCSLHKHFSNSEEMLNEFEGQLFPEFDGTECPHTVCILGEEWVEGKLKALFFRVNNKLYAYIDNAAQQAHRIYAWGCHLHLHLEEPWGCSKGGWDLCCCTTWQARFTSYTQGPPGRSPTMPQTYKRCRTSIHIYICGMHISRRRVIHMEAYGSIAIWHCGMILLIDQLGWVSPHNWRDCCLVWSIRWLCLHVRASRGLFRH